MAAGCEVEIRLGTVCLVPAVRRCEQCGVAYCLSHGLQDISQCRACYATVSNQHHARQRTQDLRKRDEAQAMDEAPARIRKIASRLSEVGSPGLQRLDFPPRLERHSVKSRFGLTWRPVDVSVERAPLLFWELPGTYWHRVPLSNPLEGRAEMADRQSTLGVTPDGELAAPPSTDPVILSGTTIVQIAVAFERLAATHGAAIDPPSASLLQAMEGK